MQYFLEILRSLSDNELVVRLMFVGLSAAAITVFVLACSVLGSALFSPTRRRLRQVTGQSREPGRDSGIDIGELVEPLGGLVIPKKADERQTTEKRLIQGGFRSDNALTIYYAIRLLMLVLLPTLVLVVSQFLPSMPLKRVLTFLGIAVGAAIYGPQIVLSHAIDKRQLALRRSFPDALDLLVVCVESGLGLAAAIQRVGRELAVSHPILASELAIVNAEMRAGVDRMEALKNLADRTGLDDIQGLVTLLAQSMRFGTSIAETLRVYAEEFRDKRMQAAEEMAAKVGTKLIFPLTFCLFPAFFLVAIGPAILKIMAALANF